jgi:hypothetical protein
MAKPKKRRRRVVSIQRPPAIPIFGPVARPTGLDEGTYVKWPEGHWRPNIRPFVEGVGEATFMEANRNRPQNEANRSHRYAWELDQQRIHAPTSLIDVMRMAVDAYRAPQRVVWSVHHERAQALRAEAELYRRWA